jgi:phosphatidylserine/phosphatidylglycerophosphate/cardiolipin synthase-like enzyme
LSSFQVRTVELIKDKENTPSMEFRTLAIGFITGIILGSIISYAITVPQTSAYEKQVKRLSDQLTQLQQADPYVTIATKDTQITLLNQQITQKDSQITALQNQIDFLRANSLDLIQVSFSRVDDTSSLIRTWIGRANSTIDVAVYSFTQDSLADALVSARNRGVAVRVLMDSGTTSDSGSEYSRLQKLGISIKTDSSMGLMHDKFFLIDGRIVGTGSYNWTGSAEDDNAENLLIVRSTILFGRYLNEFNAIWNAS